MGSPNQWRDIQAMRKMTENCIKDALAGESQAHVKYSIFAEKATKEGKPNVSRLFHAASFAERVHASRHLKALGGTSGDTTANLEAARGGENFEVEEMYPAFAAVAALQGEKEAAEAIDHAMKAEVDHRAFYDAAIKAVAAGGDLSADPIHVCGFCGHTWTGDIPDKCPICESPSKLFHTF
jgi:rubrerythrin